MQFDATYWVAPADNKGASKAYALLRDAMDKSGKAAVGRFVLRTKEHLVLLRAVDSSIVAHSLLFPDELVAAKEIDGLPVRVKPDAKELRMAQQLVGSLTEPWNPSQFKDTYREKLLDVIKRKEKGEEIVLEPAAKQADVLDLMAALEASVKASKKRRSPSSAAKAGHTARKTTRKSA
jgi:DNA end-binding protein Ku